jgi:uncharacterized membrane protein YhaH (DUF805 family)
MLRILRDISATAGIILVIGVVIVLIPVISAIVTGVGLLLLLCFLAALIYTGLRESSAEGKNTEY